MNEVPKGKIGRLLQAIQEQVNRRRAGVLDGRLPHRPGACLFSPRASCLVPEVLAFGRKTANNLGMHRSTRRKSVPAGQGWKFSAYYPPTDFF